MRQPHFLRTNKGCESPQEVVFVDTETRQRKLSRECVSHHLHFGWAAYMRRVPAGGWSALTWFRFTTPIEFWDWLESLVRARTRLYLFAHNWSFDGPVLSIFDQMTARGWSLTRAVIEGPPTILAWRKDTATVCVLDSLNIWRTSLAALGASVGLAKLPMPTRRASRAEWDVYCRRDVTVLHTALTRWWEFLRAHDLGGFAHTLAGQSFRSFRHRFMRHPILIDDDSHALTLARAAYHGGRCEAFRLGHIAGPIVTLDVASMYPFVMREQDYPTTLLGTACRVTPRELARLCKRRAVVADCELETDEPAYAHMMDGRLCFPIGRLRECLTTPDILYAIASGHLRKVHSVAFYERAPLFSAFVAEMWQHRLDAAARGDEVSAYLFKILMNSLYGKFGQRSGKWESHSHTTDNRTRVWDEVDADTGRVLSMRQFAGIIQQRYAAGEARESHPAIAAHVTAYARRYLWDLMTRAGRKHVFYVDTDSLWVDRIGARRLAGNIASNTLGALKVEGTHASIDIHGAKDYQTPTLARHKGVRASAVWLDESTVKQERWSSLKGLVRLGDVSAPRTSLVIKHLSRDYLKGIRQKDGRVLPLTADDW